MFVAYCTCTMSAVSLNLAIYIITTAQGMDMAQARDIKLVPYHGVGYTAQSVEVERLQGYYEVLIFFSNGVDEPGYRGICADHAYSEEATVICNQLGQTGAHFALGNTNRTVWLKEVYCEPSEQHILRCTNTVIYGSDRTNPTTCGPRPNKFLIKCDEALPPYDGKLALCPADNALSDPSIKLSVSFGMVNLYLAIHGTWRGLETKKLLRITEANAICRQMGFTGALPGSAVAQSASNIPFNKCFDNSDAQLPFRLHYGPWMSTDDVKCAVPQECFTCCYSYPSESDCKDCTYDKHLIISCSFDPTAVELDTASAGSKSNCQLSSGNKPSHCESGPGSSKTISDLRVGLGIVTTLLIILGPFGIICLCYLYRKYLHQRCMGVCRACRQCEYRRMPQDNDDQPGN